MSVSIGDNIRALRIKAGMTQSRLAERLGVTDQAVSKWETGAASPDLSLIVPLTRLFGVTADALLGIDRPAEEARRQALEAQWEETMMTGDTAVRLEAAQKLADAQPDDPARRLQLAGAEETFAVHAAADDAERRRHFEQAVREYEAILAGADPAVQETVVLQEAARFGVVRTLSALGRCDEAKAYAVGSHRLTNFSASACAARRPSNSGRSGSTRKLEALVNELEFGKCDLVLLQAAEQIVKLLISDGNYLYYHDVLMHNAVWQAQCLTRAGDAAGAVGALQKARSHAEAYDALCIKGKGLSYAYTCPAFDRMRFRPDDLMTSGTTTLSEDLQEYLSNAVFDPLRMRDDFCALLR